MEILTSAESIFDNGNRHMQTKFRYIGKSEQNVIKYIISKLRKYHGQFFEKYKAIAAELQTSTKTIQRAVKHAEQMGIFQVSERFEPTLDGKMRKTTNLINLLPYAPFEMINGVLKVVRVVKKAIKLVEVAREIVTKKKSSHRSAPKKSIRTEMLPEWFEEDESQYIPKQEINDKEIEEKKAGILAKLALFRK